MKIVYRESIKKTAEGDGRYVKQSGGSGFYGVVKMRFEPAEESVFAEEVFGGRCFIMYSAAGDLQILP